MGKGGQGQAFRPYSGKHLLETLDISRSSLRYYERIGLISPQRVDENGYRFYSDQDVFRMLAYATMRTLGYTANEAVDFVCGSDDVFNQEALASHILKVEDRIAYDKVLLEALRRVAGTKRALDEGRCEPVLCDIPEVLFFRDYGELGYDGFQTNDALKELVKHFPISCVGAVFEGYPPADATPVLWGRMLPSRHRGLISLKTEPSLVIGGSRGFKVPLTLLARDERGLDPETLEAVEKAMAAQDLVACGRSFLADVHPIAGERFFAMLYVPVAAETAGGSAPMPDGMTLVEGEGGR